MCAFMGVRTNGCARKWVCAQMGVRASGCVRGGGLVHICGRWNKVLENHMG